MNKRNTLILALLAVALCLTCRHEPATESIPDPSPVVDTLKTLFAELQESLNDGSPNRFFDMIDPREMTELRQLVRQHGYLSLTSYIKRQFRQWPDLDTLALAEVKQSGDYLRLTFAGPGTRFGYREPRVRYTFLLFHRYDRGWLLAALTDIENDKYDPYGYETSYHETDLPPLLRFPRCL